MVKVCRNLAANIAESFIVAQRQGSPRACFFAKGAAVFLIHIYSNPSLSRHLLYYGICISHESSGTTPPRDCLHPTYWRLIFNLSTPAKNKIKVANFGIHICKLTITMQKSLF